MIKRRKVMFEEDLHDIFVEHPYLLVDEKPIIKIVHEYKLNENSIPDIMIKTGANAYFFEVKNSKLNESHLFQAQRYQNYLKDNEDCPDYKNYLVTLIGTGISDILTKKAEKHGIKIKTIGKSIPKQLKICRNCRKAYDSVLPKCFYCSSQEILEIITLKD